MVTLRPSAYNFAKYELHHGCFFWSCELLLVDFEKQRNIYNSLEHPEAATGRVYENMFLKIFQYLHENTSVCVTF